MALLTLRDGARAAIDDAEGLIAELGRKAIRPVYRDKWRRPDHVGTCTFLEVDGLDYMVTAAHVIDHSPTSTLFVGAGTLHPITLTFMATTHPSGNRFRDRADFAFAKVDRSWRARGVEPIPVSNLAPRDDAPFYSAYGYPNSRNRKYNPVKQTIRPTPRQFISTPTDDPAAFRAVGLTPGFHLALRRSAKYGSYHGRRVKMFEPRGMSGGLMFGLYGMQRIGVVGGTAEPLIVPAALITERRERHQILFGSRIDAIVDVIRRGAARRS